MSKEPLLAEVELANLPALNQTTLSVKQFKASIDRAISSITISRKFLRQGILTATPNTSNTTLFAITKAMKLIKFDPETQEVRAEIVVGKYKLTCVSISQDESIVAVGNIEGQIYLIDTKSFKVTHHINFDRHCKGIRGIAISQDGSYARVLTMTGDLIGTNLAHGSKPGEAKIKGQSFMLMRPNGDFFIGSGYDLRLLDQNLGVIKTYEVRDDIKTIFQTPKNLLVDINGVCEIIDIEKGNIINDIYIPENVSFMTLSSDEKVLLIAQTDGKVTANDLEYEERFIDFEMNTKRINYIFNLPGENRFGTLSEEVRVSMVNVPQFKSYETFKTTSDVFRFISDQKIAYIERDSLFIYNTVTKVAERVFKQRRLSPAFVFVEPAYFIMADDKELIVFNVDTSVVCRFASKKSLYTYNIDANPSVTSLAIAASDKTVVVFNCIDFSFKCELIGHTNEINDLIFLDNDTIASCSTKIHIWSVLSESQVGLLTEHEAPITVLASKGPYLFSASEDFSIFVWNWRLRIKVMELNGDHSGRINSLTITEENLISTSSESIVFWDIKTFTSIFTMKPLVKCVSLKSSGDYTMLCYSNGTSVILLENPYAQSSFEILGGELNDVPKFLTMVKSITSLNEVPYNSDYTHWIIMPFRTTLGHIFVGLNSDKGLVSFIEDGGCIINNSNGQNILSQAVEKNLDTCTNVIIAGLKSRLEANPYTFGFVTHDMLQSLNIKGSEMLFKLYESIYKTSIQNGLEKFCPSSVSLPIYNHSYEFEVTQSTFFTLSTDQAEEMQDGTSVEFKQSLVMLSTEVGSVKSKEFLESLNKCPNEDIFKTPFVQDLLIEKWGKVKWILYLQGLLYFFQILNFAYLVIYPEDIKAMIISLFILNLLLTFYEIVQLWLLLGAYFGDPWNWVDAFRFVLMNIFIFMVWSDVPIDATQPGFFTMFNLTGIVTILVYLRGISYFRLFEATRYMIDLIQEVLIDMAGFLMILTYSVFSFAFIFYAFSFQLPGEETGLINYTIFSYMINMGAGETQNNSFINIIFYLSTLINPIILLNLLISIMGSTFERVESSRTVSNYKELTSLILEAEQLFFYSKKSNEASYLQSCLEPPQYEPPEALYSKVKKLSVKVTGIQDSIVEVDEKIDTVLQKLQEVIEAVSKKA